MNMLESVKITRRQSEIRQSLAGLVGKSDATADEIRSMETMDAEYRQNEVRYRAALVAEDTERREAGADLETRSDREWQELLSGFELRQVALFLDEARAIDGRTAEIVTELRSAGGYRGIPVPWGALERRNTVAAGTPNPLETRPIIDRLFPDSVAARMGIQMISIDAGLTEWPVTTSAVTAGWQATEAGSVAGPTAFTTVDKALAPNNTLGIRMAISRKALKQTGTALEDAVRRDMNGALAAALDKAIFLGTGAAGEPLGIIPGVGTYGITSTAIAAGATWSAFRAAVTRFMAANAAGSPDAVKLLIRPEVWGKMDNTLITSTAVSEWDRMIANIPLANIAMSPNALAVPTGTPIACTALLATNAGGIAPAFVGVWGAVDLIRDPFSDAASGGLRLTALTTADVTVARGVQMEVLTNVQVN
jgi:HK97 family phage major capsid protein